MRIFHPCSFVCFVAFTCALAQAEPSRKITFGVMAPLTGDFASAGGNIRKGIALAEERLNNEGISVQVRFEDACLPAAGVAAFRKLIHQDGIEAVVSNYCVITMAAVKDTAKQEKIPFLQNSVFPEEQFKGNDFLVSTWPSIDEEVEETVKVAVKSGAKRAAVLYLTTQWGQGYYDSLKRLFERTGGEIVAVEQHVIGASDFKGELTRVARAKPDFIFMAHTGTMLAGMLKQARSLKITAPVFVPSDADDQAIVSAAEGAAEGVSLFTTSSKSEGPEAERFAAEFGVRFGETPNPLARHAYDQLMIAGRAAAGCGKNGECLIRELRRLGPYQGVSGTFTLVANGGAKREFLKRVVKHGAFQFAEGETGALQ